LNTREEAEQPSISIKLLTAKHKDHNQTEENISYRCNQTVAISTMYNIHITERSRAVCHFLYEG